MFNGMDSIQHYFQLLMVKVMSIYGIYHMI